MTTLIIQIPAFNEAEHLAETIGCLPREISGVDVIEYLVIDDGSTDGTAKVARNLGVHHIVRHRRNRGLAAAFRTGVEASLAAGADIIVNTDADNQYVGEDIALIVAPILEKSADLVVGDRGVGTNENFGYFKRHLQRIGSATVRRLSGIEINDAVSGFRAFSREAAGRIQITNDFSYTTEMLIQAGKKRLKVVSVPIRTNGPVRPSRLFESIPQFIFYTGSTILRSYATFNALRVFLLIGGILAVIGVLPILRFLYFFLEGDGDGHVQSLVLGIGLLVLGGLSAMLGIMADLISANRKLLETVIVKLQQIERDQNPGIEPEDEVNS